MIFLQRSSLLLSYNIQFIILTKIMELNKQFNSRKYIWLKFNLLFTKYINMDDIYILT